MTIPFLKSIELANTKYYNWTEIVKIRFLPEWFINKFIKQLDMTQLCLYQPLSLQFINSNDTSGGGIDYRELVRNPNLSDEVKEAKIAKMDWDLFQQYQQMSSKMLETYWDQLDHRLIFQYQKLPEVTMCKILYDYSVRKDERAKGLLELALTFQTFTEEGLKEVIKLGSEYINPDLVSQSQTLSGNFLRQWLIDHPDQIYFVCKCQHLDTEFMERYLLPHPELPILGVLSEVQEILLEHQEINLNLLRAFVQSSGFHDNINNKKWIKAIATHQICDLDLVRLLSQVDNSVFITIFMRIAEVTRPSTSVITVDSLQLSSESSTENDKELKLAQLIDINSLAPLIDWESFSKRSFGQDWLSSLLENANLVSNITIKVFCDNVSWYHLFKSNPWLTDSQLRPVYRRLNHIQLWAMVTFCKISHEFLKEVEIDAKWWNFSTADAIKPTVIENVASSSSSSTGESNKDKLKDFNQEFITDFVTKAKWADILRYEQLPEWFMKLFDQHRQKIEMYWWKLCRYQKLSEAFIKQNIDRVDLTIVLKYQTLSPEFLKEYQPFVMAE